MFSSKYFHICLQNTLFFPWGIDDASLSLSADLDDSSDESYEAALV